MTQADPNPVVGDRSDSSAYNPAPALIAMDVVRIVSEQGISIRLTRNPTLTPENY